MPISSKASSTTTPRTLYSCIIAMENKIVAQVGVARRCTSAIALAYSRFSSIYSSSFRRDHARRITGVERVLILTPSFAATSKMIVAVSLFQAMISLPTRISGTLITM
ncbi:hypothetical protein M0802_002485 [Mischocyttarus mexicanus]|nr:hypothetical protein M0802_002485 [Mischocyttarus mexicanus]